MRKLIAAVLMLAFAGATLTAYAGHGTGAREDDGTGKKHGKKHPKEDKGAADKKDEAKK